MIWILIFVSIVNVVFGVTVLRRTRNQLAGITFMALEVATAAWALGVAGFMSASTLIAAQLYVNGYYIAAMAIGSGILMFALTDNRKRVSYIVPIVSCLPLAVLLLTLSFMPQMLVEVVGVTGSLTDRVVIHAFPYILYALTFVACYGAALIMMVLHAVRTHGVERRRRCIVVGGVVVTSIFGLIFNLILPWFGQYDFIMIGPLFTIVFSVAVGYSIMRYSTLELKRSFTLSLSYVFSLAFLAILYSFVIGFLGVIFSNLGRDEAAVQLIYIVTALCAAIIFQPVQRYFTLLTEKVFLRNDYNTTDILNQLGIVISESKSLGQLTRTSLSILDTTLYPNGMEFLRSDTHHTGSGKRFDVDYVQLEKLYSGTRFDVLVVDDESSRVAHRLKKNGVAAVIKLQTTYGMVGFILLGDKKSGEPFTTKDIAMLRTFADTLSVAVENSLRYDDIRKFNETLKDNIETATEELRAANKRLKLMDQTKDEFISLTSHQLRTPLTTIKGYLSMLLEGDAGQLSEQQRKLVEEAFNSSQRMVHLISDFLNISRIQTGKFVVELSDANLADILDEEIDQLRVSAKSRDLQLLYDKPANFPVMPIDEGKIRQVMMNFIDNAIYYSPAGSAIHITLSYTASKVEFKVIDQGIGVPKVEQHKLFSKFSRASNAKKQRPDGTGIGLFMAKKVIVALHGAIIFKSEEGKGSTFGFSLNRQKTTH